MAESENEIEHKKDEMTKAEKRAIRQEKRAKKRKEREKKRKTRSKWHPLSILRAIGLFFLVLLKIIYFPYVYAFWKIRDTFKFLGRNDPEDLDNDLISEEDGDDIPDGYIDEKAFLRSLPMFYFIAGTLGGIIAIFIAFDFMDPVWKAIGDFFRYFSWASFWADIGNIFKIIFVDGIWVAMKWFGLGIRDIVVYLFDAERFWITLTIIVVIGVGIIIVAVIFSEVEFSGKFIKKIKAFFKAIFTFPRTLWGWIKKAYKATQIGISRFTFGERKLKFFQKRFFYRVVIYSSVITLWIVLAQFGVVLGTELAEQDVNYKLLYPSIMVAIGIINGVILLAFLSWFVGILSKDKYIIDIEAHNKYLEERKQKKEQKKKKVTKKAS